ncbi:MAG: serine--tRNA ligase [Candidatus Harrisonbacteria bacterium CG10_big_fil_rev_8_21_14_0_10_38_8]|uniref:Serine--tRNA ligase n=1 Tax=Candidatus Harrisonbacteria bacterium CG10_big_fil_rev_8_21_14_0_10_38_8 TaxID=1974582 RepID=A0A2M6WKP5_9BACT|nr:MAG: serine--tRNA ligase [Candidatus Harrisonbacteria bacterium CG10_big_fil_rev_8_21_14_0_10_38_8]
MIDINIIRQTPEVVKASLIKRARDPQIVDEFLSVDQSWKNLQTEIDNLKAKQKEKGSSDIEGAKALKQTVISKTSEYQSLDNKRNELLLQIPNILLDSVPEGKNEDENKVIKTWGEIPVFDFPVKDHLELGTALDLIDNERASKVTGARFTYLKGGIVHLQFALSQFVLKTLTSKEIIAEIASKISPALSSRPFIPVLPPTLVKTDTYIKMGRLTPENKDDKYKIEGEELYLIGSAEHTLGPVHMNETFNPEELPIRYLGYSTSFRREAGTYGKDTKGILRMHQFDKWEMETFTTKDQGEAEHELLLAVQEYLMQKLEIPYQVVANCAGDTQDPNAHQYDIEAWLPGQAKYRETHSADYMTDYQSRRLKIKVGKEFVYMNDATALSMRPLIAILENNQTKEGKIKIPKVLVPYTGFEVIE